MRYEIGDIVRIATDTSKSNKWNKDGQMNKRIGKTMTVRDNSHPRYYKMEEDYNDCPFREGGWAWYPEMIEGLAPDESPTISSCDFMEVLSL